MIRSRQWNNGPQLLSAVVVYVILVLFAGTADAQSVSGIVAEQASEALRAAGQPFDVPGAGASAASLQMQQRPSIASDLSALRAGSHHAPAGLNGTATLAWNGRQGSAFQAAPVGPQRSSAHKVVGGIIGAVGGFFMGGYLGAAVEPSCNCDDPGLAGFTIGAPIGAVLGGIFGPRFF